MAVTLSAAAQFGVHLLSSQGTNGVAAECNGSSSVSFACKWSSISAPTFSMSHRIRAGAAESSRSRMVVAVAAEKTMDTAAPDSTTSAAQKMQYHFVIANAKFMLDDEEHFQELMRERLRHFGELNREQDFWLVIEPEFLAKFPEVENRLGRPAVALVSTDASWITFMKLRLDRVLKGVYEADTLSEALAGGNSSVKLEFEKPRKWTAPYPKYEGDWWTPFLPPQ